MKQIDRFLLIGACLPVLMLAGPAYSESALRERVTVAAEVVLLGDVVSGAGFAADIPVARAPEPGHHLRLGTAHVFELASANGVALTPPKGTRSIFVERASRLADRQELIDAVRTALETMAHKETVERLDVTLSGPLPKLHVPVETVPVFEVNDIDYNAKVGTFSATIRVAGPKRLSEVAQVRGQAVTTMSVPALARRLGRDEVISASDIQWIDIRSDRLSQDIATDESELIGYMPRGSLKPGAPIRITSLELPKIVERDQLVTIIYQIPGMTLTAQGQTLEPGHLDKLIRVRNTHSNRVIYAEVVSPNQVMVPTVSRRIAAR